MKTDTQIAFAEMLQVMDAPNVRGDMVVCSFRYVKFNFEKKDENGELPFVAFARRTPKLSITDRENDVRTFEILKMDELKKALIATKTYIRPHLRLITEFNNQEVIY